MRQKYDLIFKFRFCGGKEALYLLKSEGLCKKVGESGRRWEFYLILPFERTVLLGKELFDKILLDSVLM